MVANSDDHFDLPFVDCAKLQYLHRVTVECLDQDGRYHSTYEIFDFDIEVDFLFVWIWFDFAVFDHCWKLEPAEIEQVIFTVVEV